MDDLTNMNWSGPRNLDDPSRSELRRKTYPEGPNTKELGKRFSQEEQDREDEEARKRNMKELTHSWMDRLKQISVITTFFALVEVELVGIAVESDTNEPGTRLVLEAANAGLIGALILHICAAIFSFLATFLLVRYKYKEATKEEMKAEGRRLSAHKLTESPSDLERGEGERYSESDTETVPAEGHRLAVRLTEPPVLSTDPRLEQVSWFTRYTPRHILSHFHALCLTLSVLGFVLAIMGVILFSWAKLPTSVSIFATVCLGVCILGAILTISIVL